MPSPAELFWSLIFSSIGLAYFMYGKKQVQPIPIGCGLLLMVYPYFVGNLGWMIGVGVVLAAIPYIFR